MYIGVVGNHHWLVEIFEITLNLFHLILKHWTWCKRDIFQLGPGLCSCQQSWTHNWNCLWSRTKQTENHKPKTHQNWTHSRTTGKIHWAWPWAICSWHGVFSCTPMDEIWRTNKVDERESGTYFVWIWMDTCSSITLSWKGKISPKILDILIH